MNEDIFTKIKTKESLELLMEELQLILKSFYEAKAEDLNSVLTYKVRSFVSDFFKNKISDTLNPEAYIKEIIEKGQKLQTVKLFLAFEPSEGAIDHFYSFITSACGSHVLLDISCDPSLIGGAVIIFKGQYRDFSFRKIFQKEFSEEQQNLLKLLEK